MNFKQYAKDKKELEAVRKRMDNLQEMFEKIPVIRGKVTASLSDYPYTPAHVDIEMPEPEASRKIKDRIYELKKREKVLLNEMEKVEDIICSLPDGVERQVLEMVFIDGMTQEYTANILGYTQSNIAKIVKKVSETKLS